MAKQQATSKESMAGEAATGVAPAATGVATHIGGRPNLEDRARAETLQTAGGLTLTVAMVADFIEIRRAAGISEELTVVETAMAPA